MRAVDFPITVAQSTTTPDGTEFRSDGTDPVWQKDGVVERMPTRLMFCDLRGTAVDADTNLIFATSSESESFLPPYYLALVASFGISPGFERKGFTAGELKRLIFLSARSITFGLS